MAVGCIGLSLDEFCKYYYEEFESICKAWREMTDAQNRDAWERTRTLAAITIQPHVKKGTKITPKKLLPLPWDKKKETEPIRSDEPKLTPEQKQKRFEELAHRLGDETNL